MYDKTIKLLGSFEIAWLILIDERDILNKIDIYIYREREASDFPLWVTYTQSTHCHCECDRLTAVCVQ